MQGKIYRPGFTAGSEERLKKAQQQKMAKIAASIPTPTMPPRMILGMEAIINAACNTGLAQLEIALGKSADDVKNIRVIAVHDSMGEIKEFEGKKVIVFAVPYDLGAGIVEVKKEEPKCDGSPDKQ